MDAALGGDIGELAASIGGGQKEHERMNLI